MSDKNKSRNLILFFVIICSIVSLMIAISLAVTSKQAYEDVTPNMTIKQEDIPGLTHYESIRCINGFVYASNTGSTFPLFSQDDGLPLKCVIIKK